MRSRALCFCTSLGELLCQLQRHKFSGEKHAISERRNAGRGFHPLGQFDGAAGKGDAM
jgi:hypothetical protein